MQLDTRWDPPKVAAALVRAYGLLDGAPVISRGDGFTIDDQRVDACSLTAWIGMCGP